MRSSPIKRDGKMTRRKFLGGSATGALVAGAAMRGWAGQFGTSAGESKPAKIAAAKAGIGLSLRDKKTLAAALDELIPASDGMPSATEVGGVDYLDRIARLEPGISSDLRKGLAALESLSQKRFGKTFASLEHEQRVQTLTGFEQSGGANFSNLRDCAYEAYYVQPRVWKLIGYDFHSTSEGGPAMKPWDDSVLAEVRKKPKYYREVR